MTRRIPDVPCIIMFVQLVEQTEKCNLCDTVSNIQVEVWLHLQYQEELEQRGINHEYASQLSIATSIRHQRNRNSKPYDSMFLCKNHFTTSIQTITNIRDKSKIDFMIAKFNKDNPLAIYDENSKDTISPPKLVVGDFKDIWQLLDKLQELEDEE